jgi:hypothetical protein
MSYRRRELSGLVALLRHLMAEARSSERGVALRARDRPRRSSGPVRCACFERHESATLTVLNNRVLICGDTGV